MLSDSCSCILGRPFEVGGGPLGGPLGGGGGAAGCCSGSCAPPAPLLGLLSLLSEWLPSSLDPARFLRLSRRMLRTAIQMTTVPAAQDPKTKQKS